MREVKLLSALAFLLLVTAPVNASVVWSENFEASTANMDWNAHNVASGWFGFQSRGDNVGGGNYEIHHVTNEVDNANPANFVQGTGNALGVPPEPFSGADAKQLELGAVSGSGTPVYGGVFKLITGLPIGIPLTLDGWSRCRGSTGASTSTPFWGDVIINDNTSQLPVSGTDYTLGTVVWKKSRTNNTANGGGKMSAWKDATGHTNGQFTTTDGNVLILVQVFASGSLNKSTDFQFDDLYITPEPASLSLFGIAAMVAFRRRPRRA